MLKGMICLWFGLINAIPDGWLVCDGTNDTPDLRNKILVCAGDTYDPGDTAGLVPHAHAAGYTATPHTWIGGTAITLDTGKSNVSGIAAETFGSDPTQIMPPYHALAYIMKEG